VEGVQTRQASHLLSDLHRLEADDARFGQRLALDLVRRKLADLRGRQTARNIVRIEREQRLVVVCCKPQDKNVKNKKQQAQITKMRK
jgi:hypothetical protein